MSSIRRLRTNADTAHGAYTHAAAALVLARMTLGGEHAETERLARRATAYEVQWNAAERRYADAVSSREGVTV